MSMTKQHFETIAQTIHDVSAEFAGNEGAELALERVAYDLADYFGKLNDRFDDVRFLVACGVQEPTTGQRSIT